MESLFALSLKIGPYKNLITNFLKSLTYTENADMEHPLVLKVARLCSEAVLMALPLFLNAFLILNPRAFAPFSRDL